MHPQLSVNINKTATLRNARGGNLPDILKVAKDCESFGAFESSKSAEELANKKSSS